MASNQNTTSQQQQQENQPGLVAGHAEYIKGAAEAAIGSITGSHAWKGSGEQDKAHAVSAMKAAGDKRDPAMGYGKAEAMVGKAFGCEGMEKEGEASMKKE